MPSPYRKDDPRVHDVNVRFWNKVEMSNDGCWEWFGSKDRYGYGRFGIEGKLVGAHRFAFYQFNGTIPYGKCILHHCDNSSRVHPDHLYAGGQRENMIDREMRGRGIGKLTPDQVREIRSRNEAGEMQSALRKEFGISDGHISEIIGRTKWSWVD